MYVWVSGGWVDGWVVGGLVQDCPLMGGADNRHCTGGHKCWQSQWLGVGGGGLVGKGWEWQQPICM